MAGRATITVLALAISAGAMAACSNAYDPGVACTEIFAMSSVYVRDTTGAPVTDATLRTILLRTGEQLVPQTLALMTPGNYVIVDDGARNTIRQSGDDLRVTGTSASGSFSADYVFDVPEGCHINKVSGPDTVTAR